MTILQDKMTITMMTMHQSPRLWILLLEYYRVPVYTKWPHKSPPHKQVALVRVAALVHCIHQTHQLLQWKMPSRGSQTHDKDQNPHCIKRKHLLPSTNYRCQADDGSESVSAIVICGQMLLRFYGSPGNKIWFTLFRPSLRILLCIKPHCLKTIFFHPPHRSPSCPNCWDSWFQLQGERSDFWGLWLFFFGLAWHRGGRFHTMGCCKYQSFEFDILQADMWARSYLVFVVLSLDAWFIPSLAPRCCFPSLGLTWWRGSRMRRNIPWRSVSRLGRL